MQGARGFFLNQEATLFAAQPLEEHRNPRHASRNDQQQRDDPEEVNSLTTDLTHSF
jgi:hypothetical protein